VNTRSARRKGAPGNWQGPDGAMAKASVRRRFQEDDAERQHVA
jgi:hypothetical protein